MFSAVRPTLPGNPLRRSLSRFLSVFLAAAFLSSAALLLTAPPAHAAPATHAAPANHAAAATHAAVVDPVVLRGERVVAAARAQQGRPYRHGAVGPRAFDCSGLTTYAYRSVRVTLPRTANAQFHAAQPISRAAARPGDLVFWVQGGHAYHVGVYAGAGQVWHAPKTGDHVRLARIWSWREVHFGRIAG
ncbi:C40 family peptidase [Actinoplanes sp. NPDC026619]|uniref:C40 family peptidase n=1 Tax=Actinoplanes sp. NPDC026619 TaxID=3155798 RepID=UPI0033F76901